MTFLIKLLTGGHIRDFFSFIKDMVEMLRGNKEKDNVREYNEAIATKEQFAKEFSYGASNRNVFDSIVDGFNRLPRPVITFGVIGLFWWAFASPDQFQVSMKAMNHIPEPMWTALYMVLGLYFSARTLEKISLPKPKVIREKPRVGVKANKRKTDNNSIDEWFSNR